MLSPGYKGIAKLVYTGTSYNDFVRCNDFNLNLQQDTLFYDHVIGLRDTIPTDGMTTKGEKTTLTSSNGVNFQKKFWRPGTKIIQGNLSFPATEDSLERIFTLVKTGNWFAVEHTYDCVLKRIYSQCRVNGFTFSVTAGDIVNISLDVTGRYFSESSSTSNTVQYTTAQKLITWDIVSISVDGGTLGDNLQSFELSVSNNCFPIYTSGGNTSNNLYPYDIRVGMQEVTGTLSYYVRGVGPEGLSASTVYRTITLKIGSFTQDLTVVLKPVQRASNISAPIHTVAFIGVDKPLGDGA